jgi:hypothetical protein
MSGGRSVTSLFRRLRFRSGSSHVRGPGRPYGPGVLSDVVLHFALEALGALGLRCTLKVCRHVWHRAAVWIPFGLGTSWLTVLTAG